jgi:hypothetical protein
VEGVWVIRNKLHGEEQARFNRQLEANHEQLAKIGRHRSATQKLPIGNPSPIPKQKYIIQMRTHSRADVRGLTGPGLADRALTAKERAEKTEQRSKGGKARPATPEDDDGVQIDT